MKNKDINISFNADHLVSVNKVFIVMKGVLKLPITKADIEF